MYYVRTAEGIAVAKIDNEIAGKMMKRAGKWVEKKYVDKTSKTVFQFQDNFSYGVDEMSLMIWSGFYLTEAA